MEDKYAQDPQMLARLMKDMVSAMFDTPIKGRDCINGPRFALEMKIEESINKSLTKADKDAFSSCINHIMLRVQDFSTTDLDIPSKAEEFKNSTKEELLASRYNIEIKTNDLKNVNAGGHFSEKIINFFANFLNEKKQKLDKIYDKCVFDLTFFNQIFDNYELDKQKFKLCLKSIEAFLGAPYGFKKLKRVFFLGKSSSNKLYIIEYVKKNHLINEKIKSSLTIRKSDLLNNQKNNVLILYETYAEYNNTKSEQLLEDWKIFIAYMLKESGEKIDIDDFELISSKVYQNTNLYESGSVLCSNLSLLFEQDLDHNNNMLLLIENKDLAHIRNRIKNLIETIGVRSDVSEYILRKY